MFKKGDYCIVKIYYRSENSLKILPKFRIMTDNYNYGSVHFIQNETTSCRECFFHEEDDVIKNFGVNPSKLIKKLYGEK